MPEIKYEITEHIGVISETARGWTREVNMISWNGPRTAHSGNGVL